MGQAPAPARNVPKLDAISKPPVIRGPVRSIVAQATELKSDLRRCFERGDRQFAIARESLAAELGQEISPDAAADVLAQAVACAIPIIAAQPPQWQAATAWLAYQSSDWERCILEVLSTKYSVLSTQYIALHSPQAFHLYEPFLHAWQRTTRKRRGVFFTPQPIADYIVGEIDQSLRKDFDLAGGLATPSAICLLDPACGTGVFLLAVLDRLHRDLGSRFSDFVPDLLKRLTGIEILPAAAFLTRLNIALKLAETGYTFRQPGKINIHCGDALDPNLQFAIRNLQFEIPVIVGNPPFSSLSTNTNDWIARLVRGDEAVRGYVRANGQELGERKTWLHDDYVKFIRLAQWHVEQAGRGIVGFVTNHGYLHNATFRLMRSELLRVFPHIQIVDLHGSRKSGEAAPDGRRDENVFGLEQGVAIAILTRSVSEGIAAQIEYRDLWGSRAEKLAALATPSLTLRVSVHASAAPHWRFIPIRETRAPEYDAGWLLTDLMPVHTTAPVTARDHFVVAFTEEELRRRIEDFRDLSIPDDEIRRRYFQRTRSARYERGDTRGWKLAAARPIVAADENWHEKIVRCLYRPFDWRYVFWHPAMIDWPRNEITRHLLPSTQNPKSKIQNLCLLARRQQLPTQPCTFFWISDGLALDGVIRSDNRGSESLFPLYLFEGDEQGQNHCRANFAPVLMEQFAQRVGLAWLPLGRGDLVGNFGLEDLLAYIYALFHSPHYRERYADRLRTGFPRVLPPQNGGQFRQMVELGSELINLHLLRTRVTANDAAQSRQEWIARFRAGGYVVLKKWLQPPHRSTGDPQYAQIAAAISRTLQIMPAIDAASCSANTTSGDRECGNRET